MATISKRIGKDGAISYRVEVRLKGHPRQTATFKRLTDAKRWIQSTESAIREGRHFKTTESKKRTFNDLVERYVKDVLPQKPASYDKQKAQLQWWNERLGDYLLCDVTPALIVQHRDELSNTLTQYGKPFSPATVTRYLAALSHAFSMAAGEWEWVQENPVKRVKKPTEPEGRVRYLDDDERARLLQACKESRQQILYAVVMLGLATGMRKSEIMNLYWREPKNKPAVGAWGVVHLNESCIILHRTKNKSRRRIPLAGIVVELMQEHAKVRRMDSKLVFPNRKGNKPADFRAAWEHALEKSEIVDFRFHDLRHSTASYLAMNGASLAEIAEVLGHKTLAMVKRYSHLSDGHVSSVVKSMNDKIFG